MTEPAFLAAAWATPGCVFVMLVLLRLMSPSARLSLLLWLLSLDCGAGSADAIGPGRPTSESLGVHNPAGGDPIQRSTAFVGQAQPRKG